MSKLVVSGWGKVLNVYYFLVAFCVSGMFYVVHSLTVGIDAYAAGEQYLDSFNDTNCSDGADHGHWIGLSTDGTWHTKAILMSSAPNGSGSYWFEGGSVYCYGSAGGRTCASFCTTNMQGQSNHSFRLGPYGCEYHSSNCLTYAGVSRISAIECSSCTFVGCDRNYYYNAGATDGAICKLCPSYDGDYYTNAGSNTGAYDGVLACFITGSSNYAGSFSYSGPNTSRGTMCFYTY